MKSDLLQYKQKQSRILLSQHFSSSILDRSYASQKRETNQNPSLSTSVSLQPTELGKKSIFNANLETESI